MPKNWVLGVVKTWSSWKNDTFWTKNGIWGLASPRCGVNKFDFVEAKEHGKLEFRAKFEEFWTHLAS